MLKQPLQWLLQLLGLRDRVKRRDPAEQVAALTKSVVNSSSQRPSGAEPATPPAARDSVEAREMRKALTEVLDQHAASRTTFRHLDAVERALRLKGLPGLSELPLAVLQKALRQLEGLITRWTGQLAALRSRLSLLIIELEQLTHAAPTWPMQLSVFGHGKKMQVDEMSVSSFLEINEEWERSPAGPKSNAPGKAPGS